ncbi:MULTISPECIES: sugar kinase [unclassified Thermoactinomyces]|uniref:sugar kinase n=1 Tax=unclassified Thermoactinomyces TaxID=2634588 RepID=UPI0018DBDEE2|nr:sugar kinase [Thermoactinomyces sp. CICC 10523]MBH8603689.1 sugar kinase [Thermoactinomyces sp. CICC 10522]MBH8607676.1 sugar kinase [Thermoactinomyces sp. CICC 10521]
MDVVTIGETMVLFTPQNTGLLRYAKDFSLSFAGAESNLAVGLARLGHRVGWMSQVGQDEFGEAILSFLRGEGVDTTQVKKHPAAPTGLMVKEPLHRRELRVYYYRSNSAASKMDESFLNEDYLAGAKYLHLTGITPALSGSCRAMALKAVELAKKHGVKVVFDPNYRSKLWGEAEAKAALGEIAAQADIVLPGIEEGVLLTGESGPERMASRLLERGAGLVVVKLGAKGAFYASAANSGYVEGFPVKEVADPVGAGDAFAAGLLSGLLDGLSLAEAVRRACAVAALAVEVRGDFEGLPLRETLMRFMNQSGQDVLR